MDFQIHNMILLPVVGLVVNGEQIGKMWGYCGAEWKYKEIRGYGISVTP